MNSLNSIYSLGGRILIYPTILFEVGAGLAIMIGYRTRIVALALAASCLVTAFIFHNILGDQTQFTMFMKNLAMAGGFLFLARDGAGRPGLDSRRMSTAAVADW